MTDYTKDVLVKPPTKRGKLALAEACKIVREKIASVGQSPE